MAFFFFPFLTHALENLPVFFFKAGRIEPAELCTPVAAACWVLTERLQEVVPRVSFVSHGINNFWFTTGRRDMSCEIARPDGIPEHVLPAFHFTFVLLLLKTLPPSFPS